MRRDIEFKADGVTLRGWLYKPNRGKSPFPTVVMAHGFSGVKEMTLDKYAEVFCAAGMAVLVYDNRCLGASGGRPRQDIDPTMQLRDYRSAITFAQAQKECDADRIGVWGTSYTGGTVCAVGSIFARRPAFAMSSTMRWRAANRSPRTSPRSSPPAGRRCGTSTDRPRPRSGRRFPGSRPATR